MNDLSLAINDTELYSLENVDTIPQIYRFSFADAHKSIWIFDIRTIAQFMAKGVPQKNPYTRDILSQAILEKIHARLAWLRDRKYQILHTNTDILTEEQIWRQYVLDYFLKIEALGYYVSPDWFHEMSLQEHVTFYERLRTLWEWKLGLTNDEKESIVPRSSLFRFVSKDYRHKSLRWWQKSTIGLIEQFVTRGSSRDQRSLGALYILMALVQVSRAAADALPWISDMV